MIIPYGEHTLHTSIYMYYTHAFKVEIYNVLLLISNISARVMFLLTQKNENVKIVISPFNLVLKYCAYMYLQKECWYIA